MTTLLSDSFDGSLGLHLPLRRSDVDVSGNGWLKLSGGNFELDGNGGIRNDARVTSAPFNYVAANVHAKSYQIDIDFNFASSEYFMVAMRIGSGGAATVFQVATGGDCGFRYWDGSSFTSIDTRTSNIANGNSYTLSVAVSGDSATATLNGVAYAAAMSNHADSRWIGIMARELDGNNAKTSINRIVVTGQSDGHAIGLPNTASVIGVHTVAEINDPDAIAVGDIAGRGRSDLLLCDSTGGVVYWMERGASIRDYTQHTIASGYSKIEGCGVLRVSGNVYAVFGDQVAGNVYIAAPDDQADPSGTWSVITLDNAVPKVQSIRIVRDTDNQPIIMATVEGNDASTGGLRVYKLTGSDVMVASDWTSRQTNLPGLWALSPDPIDINGDGIANQWLASSRNNNNAAPRSGLFILSPPLNVITSDYGIESIFEPTVDADFLHVSPGRLATDNGSRMDVVNNVLTAGQPITVYQHDAWTTQSLSVTGATQPTFNCRSVRLSDVGRDVVFSAQDNTGFHLHHWTGEQWHADLIAPVIGVHPCDERILVQQESDGVYLILADSGGNRLLLVQMASAYAAAPTTMSTPNEATIASEVVRQISGVRLSLQQQETFDGTTTLFVYQGDDYTSDPTQITIDQTGMADPNADLSTYKLVVSFRQPSGVKGFRMPIEGSPGSHTAVFDPPSSETETLDPGTHEALFRIEYAADKFKTFDTGFVNVERHDIEPSEIVDI